VVGVNDDVCVAEGYIVTAYNDVGVTSGVSVGVTVKFGDNDIIDVPEIVPDKVIVRLPVLLNVPVALPVFENVPLGVIDILLRTDGAILDDDVAGIGWNDVDIVIDGVGGITVPLTDAASLPTLKSMPHTSGSVSVAE
jgi:hypothetical protein